MASGNAPVPSKIIKRAAQIQSQDILMMKLQIYMKQILLGYAELLRTTILTPD